MKSSFSKLAIALAALLCLSAFMPAALAAYLPLSVQISAEITATGTMPAEPETYIICMTANEDDNPMPNGQIGGSYELSVKGTGKVTFPEMTYGRVGIYTYTISQIAGENSDCKYDARTYTVTVSVINAETGGHEIIVAMREDGKTDKIGTATFHNIYKTIVTPPGTITATGVSDLMPYYIGGSAVLLFAAFFIVRSLQKAEGGHEGR